MVTILQVFYSVFSGLLLSLSIPNELYLLGMPVFTLVAFIPYYYAIKSAKNFRFAFLYGFLQVFTTHLCSSFWLANFKDFAALTLGASAIGTAFFGGISGLLFYLPYASEKAKNRLNQNSLHLCFTTSTTFRILYFAIVYTIYEWIKSNGFLGYPWGTISSAMYNWPIIMQLSAITGIYGISFFITLENAIVAEFISYLFCRWKTQQTNRINDIYICSRLCLVLFVGIFFYGAYQYDLIRTPDRYITSILVQQNSDPWEDSKDKVSVLRSEELTIEGYQRLKKENKEPDLIVWSEGTLKFPLPSNLSHYEVSPKDKPLVTMIKELKTPLLTGGSWLHDSEKREFWNAALLFDGKGNFRGVYGKNHLVPCAEAIPFMDYAPVKNFMKKVLKISAGWTPGNQYVLFDIPCKYNPERKPSSVAEYDLTLTAEQEKEKLLSRPTAKVTAPVCFDDCFPDIMRPLFLAGSEVFMNITDDSWSLTKSSEYQHFVNASYSAIEYRTTLVRTTNGGYTVVVDPAGKVLNDLPLYERTVLTCDVPVYQRQMTTYAIFGNWLPYLFLALATVYSFYVAFTFKKSDFIPSERKVRNKKKKKNKKNKK